MIEQCARVGSCWVSNQKPSREGSVLANDLEGDLHLGRGDLFGVE